jgi:hypothetical protein
MKHIKRFNESEEYLSKGNTLDNLELALMVQTIALAICGVAL